MTFEGKNKHIGEEWAKRFKDGPSAYKLKDIDKKFFVKFKNSPYTQKIIKYANLQGNEEILEAGCASGKFSVTLAILGCKVTALDYSDQMLENTIDLKKEAERYFGTLNIIMQKGDLNDLNIEDDTFDVVFNEGVVEHWLNKNERLHVIKEMVRVTKKGGSVIIFVPNGKHPLYKWWVLTKYPGFNAPPMIRYDVKKLRKEMCAVGLKNIETNGIRAFDSISLWPRFRILSLTSGVLNGIVPLPKIIQEKFGINIVCMGKKL